MKTPDVITVLLADDHQIVREGLKSLIESEKGLKVVGEADDGRKAVALTRKLRPDVVVMDIAMPLLNGLEATRQIRAEMPESKVIILSAHSDDAYVQSVMAMGASGYLIKQTSAHVLAEAIRAVHKGGTFFSPSIAKSILHQTRQSLDRKGLPGGNSTRLTPREAEVLQLVAEGKANKQTAAELGISIKTVEKHRDRVMQKLDIHDTAGLTRYAIAAGVIESSVQLTIL